jgi:hypothetical protein
VTNLLDVDQAVRQILAEIEPLPAESVPLPAALGRVLAEDVIAGESLPPFPNSSMDGYAVRAADVSAASREGPVRLPVVMDIPAGRAPERALGPGEAARIMTGAPMPEGADAVVPVEQTDGAWTAGEREALAPFVAIYEAVRAGSSVRPIGEDVRAGQGVISAGTVIRAAGVCTSGDQASQIISSFNRGGPIGAVSRQCVRTDQEAITALTRFQVEVAIVAGSCPGFQQVPLSGGQTLCHRALRTTQVDDFMNFARQQ